MTQCIVRLTDEECKIGEEPSSLLKGGSAGWAGR